MEPTKFDQLRLKTERQLILLIGKELDLGIRDARQALTSAADTSAFAEECRLRAKKAHAKAARLILLVTDITDDEQSVAESKLDHLREMLKALSAIGTTPTPADAEIAALARIIWEARGRAEGLPEEDWFRAERVLKAQASCVGS